MKARLWSVLSALSCKHEPAKVKEEGFRQRALPIVSLTDVPTDVSTVDQNQTKRALLATRGERRWQMNIIKVALDVSQLQYSQIVYGMYHIYRLICSDIAVSKIALLPHRQEEHLCGELLVCLFCGYVGCLPDDNVKLIEHVVVQTMSREQSWPTVHFFPPGPQHLN